MTHDDCASAGQCRLDGVEKSNRAENELTFFSFAGRGIYTQQGFFLSTLMMPIMVLEKKHIFASNIGDGDHD